MKKSFAVFMAVIMLLSCFTLGFAVMADDNETPVCTCANCTHADGCHCCVYCPYLDETYLTSCVRDENGHFRKSFCCVNCTGIWPCDCGCECCESGKYQDPHAGDVEPIFSPETQEQIVSGFQGVMRKIKAVFDMIFDAIFDFLRIDDFFANN